MKKVLIMVSLVFLSISSFAESFRFVQWSGRIDLGGLDDLNRIATELFPGVTDASMTSQAIQSSEGRRNFEKLKENVTAFVKSKGFFLQTEPLQISRYSPSLSQIFQSDVQAVQTQLANAPAPNPFVERALLELFSRTSSEYFSTATSSTTYKVVDSLIAFIPIFGAFYGAKRLQDNNFGPVADAQRAQAEKYEQLQKCAYAESLETPNSGSLVNFCQEWISQSYKDGRKMIDQFREVLDYAFIINYMLKVRLAQPNCATANFGGEPQLVSQTYDAMTNVMVKYQIQSGWLLNLMDNSRTSATILNAQVGSQQKTACENLAQ